MQTYSFKKGLAKGLVSALTITLAFVTFAGFSDVTLWALLENYLKPLISGLTVGGLFTMAINWWKVKTALAQQ